MATFDQTSGALSVKPEWAETFHEQLYGLTAQRVFWIALVVVSIDLLLFLVVDLRTYRGGLWAQTDAHMHIFLWRCGFVTVFGVLAMLYLARRSSLGRDRLLSWTGAVAVVGFGTWFSIVCQPIVQDISIYALGVFIAATLFPLPHRLKLTLYPVSLAGLLGGIYLFAPDKLSVGTGNGFVNGSVLAISAAICDLIVFRGAIAIFVKEQLLEEERGRSDELLRNMLPGPIAEKLKNHSGTGIVEFHGDITILFADFVGFTQLAQRISAGKLIDLLNRLFLAFDEAAERHRIEKIKTIGDSYMAACGVPISERDHVERIANLALEMLQIAKRFDIDQELPVNFRIGMHTGPAIAGVIGRKKFCYDLWGETVNVASRLESAGLPGRIHVSEQVYHNLKDTFVLEARGQTRLKDHGELATYFLKGHRA